MHGWKDDFEFLLSHIHEILDVTCVQLKPKVALSVCGRKSHLTCARPVNYGKSLSYRWCQEMSVSSHGFARVALGQLQYQRSTSARLSTTNFGLYYMA